jgi:hypothetical protein
MNRAAPRLRAIVQRLQRDRARVRVGAPRDRLAFPIRAKVLALEIAEFVMRLEILRLEARTAFEADDPHARFAELRRKNAAGAAYADDDDIGFFDCHLTSSAQALWLAPAGPSCPRV